MGTKIRKILNAVEIEEILTDYFKSFDTMLTVSDTNDGTKIKAVIFDRCDEKTVN